MAGSVVLYFHCEGCSKCVTIDKTNGLVYEAIAGAAYLFLSFMILTAKVAQSACVLLHKTDHTAQIFIIYPGASSALPVF